MTPTEIAEHLETQANELESLATECDDSGETEQAEKCRQSAKDTRFLAEQVRNKEKNVIGELEQLQQLINQCDNNYVQGVCKVMKKLINQFYLEKREPYSTHLRNCGFQFPRD